MTLRSIGRRREGWLCAIDSGKVVMLQRRRHLVCPLGAGSIGGGVYMLLVGSQPVIMCKRHDSGDLKQQRLILVLESCI
jgi:hypothetical protein